MGVLVSVARSYTHLNIPEFFMRDIHTKIRHNFGGIACVACVACVACESYGESYGSIATVATGHDDATYINTYLPLLVCARDDLVDACQDVLLDHASLVCSRFSTATVAMMVMLGERQLACWKSRAYSMQLDPVPIPIPIPIPFESSSSSSSDSDSDSEMFFPSLSPSASPPASPPSPSKPSFKAALVSRVTPTTSPVSASRRDVLAVLVENAGTYLSTMTCFEMVDMMAAATFVNRGNETFQTTYHRLENQLCHVDDHVLERHVMVKFVRCLPYRAVQSIPTLHDSLQSRGSSISIRTFVMAYQFIRETDTRSRATLLEILRYRLASCRGRTIDPSHALLLVSLVIALHQMK